MNIFQTRVELIKELVNQNSVCAELGVLLGEFSESISNLSPQKLYLVDTWEAGEIISADQNGNNFRQYKDGIQVFEHVKKIKESGVTVLIVEQNAKAALQVSDRGIILSDGKLRLEGAADELLESPEIGEIYFGTQTMSSK